MDDWGRRVRELISGGQFDHLDPKIWDVRPEGVRIRRTVTVYSLVIEPDGSGVILVDPPYRMMAQPRGQFMRLLPSDIATAEKIIGALFQRLLGEPLEAADDLYLRDAYEHGVIQRAMTNGL